MKIIYKGLISVSLLVVGFAYSKYEELHTSLGLAGLILIVLLLYVFSTDVKDRDQ